MRDHKNLFPPSILHSLLPETSFIPQEEKPSPLATEHRTRLFDAVYYLVDCAADDPELTSAIV
jgi:hypothetical protein